MHSCLIRGDSWLLYSKTNEIENNMKPEQLYQELKDLAEKLAVTVSEQNLRTAGIKVHSGLCRVKGKDMFIMDKHASVHKKIRNLAALLAGVPHEDLYVIPAVRELLEKYGDKLIGYFQGDIGAMNQIVHLWKFNDDADRREHWNKVFADQDFMAFAHKFRPLILSQDNKLLTAAPWGPTV